SHYACARPNSRSDAPVASIPRGLRGDAAAAARPQKTAVGQIFIQFNLVRMGLGSRPNESRPRARCLTQPLRTIVVTDAARFVDPWVRGWALSCQGHDESVIEQMRAGIEQEEASGMVAPIWLYRPLAEVYLRFGRARECAEVVDKMLARAQMGQRWEEADIYRMKGEMLLMQGDSRTTDAEQFFRKAVDIARSQTAKFLELRPTMSLARLLRDTGRRDEARAMLADIYHWFTEGFDTADLKDAKALLDE